MSKTDSTMQQQGIYSDALEESKHSLLPAGHPLCAHVKSGMWKGHHGEKSSFIWMCNVPFQKLTKNGRWIGNFSSFDF